MDKNQLINQIIDILDECTMTVYNDLTDNDLEATSVMNYNVESPHTNYYECLINVVYYFLNGNKINKLSSLATSTLNDLLEKLEDVLSSSQINVDNIREALVHLDIKGFKNLNFDLDQITPDGIALLFAYIVRGIYSEYSKVVILDGNVGCGNLLFGVASSLLNDIMLIGVDNHELMAKVACMKANLLQLPSKIVLDDFLMYQNDNIDLVVSDLATYYYQNDAYHSELYDMNIRYFPYLFIEHALTLSKKSLQMYLISNDFFDQDGADSFKKILSTKGHIVSFISLPPSFFKDEKSAKSIMILTNECDASRTSVYSLPSVSDSKFIDVVNSIIDSLKEHL